MIIDTDTIDIEELRDILTERINKEMDKEVQDFLNKLCAEVRDFENENDIVLGVNCTYEDYYGLYDILFNAEWHRE